MTTIGGLISAVSLFAVTAAVPIVWIIGIILIVWGVVDLFHARMLRGVILIIIGILLGGLNIFSVIP